jgi:hypothetical protein
MESANAQCFPRARKRMHRKSYEELCAEIPVENCVAFAFAVLADPHPTEHTLTKALSASYLPVDRWNSETRLGVAHLLEKREEVVIAMGKAKEAEFAKKLVGAHERRAILAALQRTPLTAVANANGSLKDGMTADQQLTLRKVKVRTDEHGTTREVEVYDRIAAARLDAELAGDLARPGSNVHVAAEAGSNVNMALFVMPRNQARARQAEAWDECLD